MRMVQASRTPPIEKIFPDVLRNVVLVIVVIGRVDDGGLRGGGRCGISFIGLEEVKERKDEDPYQIDKVPEQARHLNSIGEVLGIALVELASRPAATNK